ncbi:MAG: helix-turn-helix domain-containing protein [Clostridiaceae bacterium]|nr:helix-turn-helix domain-containing protein [Clostridiaceae bacterium]
MKERIEVIRKTVSPHQAAEIYGLSVGTLANLRCQKRGPKFFRCGRKVLYKTDDFEKWLLSNPVLTIDSLN